MKRAVTEVSLFALAVAGATWVLGWWSVPMLGAAAGISMRGSSSGARAALGAAVGWGALLLIDAAGGRLGAIAAPLAATMRVPAVVLVLLTLMYPALLAWSGVTIGRVLRRA